MGKGEESNEENEWWIWLDTPILQLIFCHHSRVYRSNAGLLASLTSKFEHCSFPFGLGHPPSPFSHSPVHHHSRARLPCSSPASSAVPPPSAGLLLGLPRQLHRFAAVSWPFALLLLGAPHPVLLLLLLLLLPLPVVLLPSFLFFLRRMIPLMDLGLSVPNAQLSAHQPPKLAMEMERKKEGRMKRKRRRWMKGMWKKRGGTLMTLNGKLNLDERREGGGERGTQIDGRESDGKE